MKNLMLLFGLFVAFSFGLPCQIVVSQTSKGAKMECKLILKKNMTKPGEIVSAEVEIKNISKDDINIEYQAHPFEHLDLLVLDPKGKKISNTPYGRVFSPLDTKTTLTLRSGETYRHSVNIYGNSEKEAFSKPGVYRITAIFEYDKIKAHSKPVELTITPE